MHSRLSFSAMIVVCVYCGYDCSCSGVQASLAGGGRTTAAMVAAAAALFPHIQYVTVELVRADVHITLLWPTRWTSLVAGYIVELQIDWY